MPEQQAAEFLEWLLGMIVGGVSLYGLVMVIGMLSADERKD